MTAINISIEDFIKKVEGDLMAGIEGAIDRGIKSSAMRLEGLIVEAIDTAKPYPAVDRKALRGSVKARINQIPVTVEVTAPHAGIMDLGTRPFTPPFDPIYEWALRKKIVPPEKAAKFARAIQFKFKKEGIAPRNFMRAALEKFRPFMKAEIEHEIQTSIKLSTSRKRKR